MSSHVPHSSETPSQPQAQALVLGELSPRGTTGSASLLPPGPAAALSPSNPLHHVKATLTVRVGSAELTVGDLLNAREHQVLRLDQKVEAPVDVLLEGQVVARGTLVAVGDYFGVRITELPLPLKP